MGNRRLHHLSGWDIATKIGCVFSGDMNPIDHGGLFYKLDNLDHDYIPCVEFSSADGMRFFQSGSIAIPSSTWADACKLVRDCLAQFPEADRDALMEQPTFAHVMTEYLRFMYGIEHDRFEWFMTPSDVEDATGYDMHSVTKLRHKDDIAIALRKNAKRDGRNPTVLTENQALNQALSAL
jgi:hypothetical protein